MTKLISIFAFITLAACSKGKDPKDACEAIYQKGDGSKPYTGDKAKFMDACTKAGDDTRRCLQLSGEESFKDDSCGPGHGSTFKESMEIMQLGQGGK